MYHLSCWLSVPIMRDADLMPSHIHGIVRYRAQREPKGFVSYCPGIVLGCVCLLGILRKLG